MSTIRMYVEIPEHLPHSQREERIKELVTYCNRHNPDRLKIELRWLREHKIYSTEIACVTCNKCLEAVDEFIFAEELDDEYEWIPFNSQRESLGEIQ